MVLVDGISYPAFFDADTTTQGVKVMTTSNYRLIKGKLDKCASNVKVKGPACTFYGY